jgi:hypothetical protein
MSENSVSDKNPAGDAPHEGEQNPPLPDPGPRGTEAEEDQSWPESDAKS